MVQCILFLLKPQETTSKQPKESRGWTKVRFFVSTGFQLNWPQSIFPFAAIWPNFSEFCADKDRNTNANRRGGWRGGWPCGGGRWILQLPMVNSCSKQEHSAKTFTQTFLYHSYWNGFSLLETFACTMDKVNIDSNFEEGVRLITRPNPLPCALLGGEPYSRVQYCMLCCIFRPEQSFVNPVVQCNVIKCWACAFD